jgi:hypothetical protein
LKHPLWCRRGGRLPRWLIVLFFLLDGTSAWAQYARGELRVEVRDPQGAALAPSGELISAANQLHRTFRVATDGHYIVRDLPFGVYRLTLSAQGFAAWMSLIEIRAEVPVHVPVTLGLAPVRAAVEVNDSATLVDPYRRGTQYAIGRQTLSEHLAVQPGRNLSDLVDELPGWLYEANGVLHPRGAEYEVQYVLDGLPLTQNRSPAFAPAFDPDEVESLQVLTAGFPAEYGRKLGGVVEVTTGKDVPSGLHGRFDAGGGSFSTTSGSAGISYAGAHDRFVMNGNGFQSDRYLDPAVLRNFTNHANGGGLATSYERELSDRTRLRFTVLYNRVHFQVPNYLVQEAAGQRQDRINREMAAAVRLQHTISPDLFLSLAGSLRAAAATLTSNQSATPVILSQDRGYREGYIRADLAGHHGHHDWKAGVDGAVGRVRETLQYAITDPTQFDPATQPQFLFSDRRWDVEPSAYVQDRIHVGTWNVSAGLRFDHYRLAVSESAWSPRLSVSRNVPSLNVLIHASYDRVFQTPAVENLLLASSPQFSSVNPFVVRLPVRPARGNYYEVGITKALGGVARLDVNVFRRAFRNYSDDDVLLDTGVSVPIAFASAQIVGDELRLELKQWGRFAGSVSYANQSGRGQGPITGGLFLGADATSRLTDTSSFAVTQDQRNTAHARVRCQASARLWLALDGHYGSGLPADTTADPALLSSQYGAAILSRVNLQRGRVGPSFSLDAGAGLDVYHAGQRRASVQIGVANLMNRVNVINFASLFSGTAVSPPRSVAARLRVAF